MTKLNSLSSSGLAVLTLYDVFFPLIHYVLRCLVPALEARLRLVDDPAVPFLFFLGLGLNASPSLLPVDTSSFIMIQGPKAPKLLLKLRKTVAEYKMKKKKKKNSVCHTVLLIVPPWFFTYLCLRLLLFFPEAGN